MAPGEGPGTTAVEMALDFEATTGVPLTRASEDGERKLGEKGRAFVKTAMRVAELCKGHVGPGKRLDQCGALKNLKYPSRRDGTPQRTY